MQADLTGFQIDLLAFADEGADFHVDDAVLAERADARAVFCVERHEAIAGGDVEDPIVTSSVRLSAGLRDKVALLLVLVGPLQEGQGVEPGMDREDDPERGVRPLHLLAQQCEGDVVHPGAAVALRNRQAQQPGGAHLLVERAVVGRR